MKTKKTAALLLTAIVTAMPISAVNVTAQEDVIVIVNGEKVDFTGDQPPVIQNGRTLVPFRAVFEKMGAEVNWFEDIRLCEATYGGVSVGIKIGETTVSLGEGANIESNVPAQIINSRTMVPLRVLSESIGAQVDWDGDTRTVVVTTSPITGESPEKLDYTMENAGVRNMDTDVTVNYSYPVITTEYTFKDKLNEIISADVTEAMESLADSYEGNAKEIEAESKITYNEAGIFMVTCTFDGKEIMKNGYGIINAARIDEKTLQLILSEDYAEGSENTDNGVFEMATYEVCEQVEDGTNYIYASVEYPVFSGSGVVESLNTQLENSSKKAADSFIASYAEKSLEVYNTAEKLFEPPYNFYQGCEVSINDNIAEITFVYHEVHYGDNETSTTDVIRVNIETGEVV